MGYSAWSVVFGEQPSAAKWNILGSNDAAFNNAGGVLAAGLALASGQTGGVSTQANAGSAGGTIYWINLGGIKLMWGVTTSQTIGGAAPASATLGITFPAFFTTVQAAIPVSGGISANTQYSFVSTASISTSALSLNFNIVSGSAGIFQAHWLVIGT